MSEIKTYSSGVKKIPRCAVQTESLNSPIVSQADASKLQMLQWYRYTVNAIKHALPILGIKPCDKCGK